MVFNTLHRAPQRPPVLRWLRGRSDAAALITLGVLLFVAGWSFRQVLLLETAVAVSAVGVFLAVDRLLVGDGAPRVQSVPFRGSKTSRRQAD